MRCQRFSIAFILVSVVLLTGCSSFEASSFHRGVVAADHALGSDAGLEMLKRGGNAVDAAVATSFCQAVVRPYSCGLGGGGFMMIHLAETDENIVLVYREEAPAAMGPDFYMELDEVPNASRTGPYAVGVPGTVAGLLYALEEYGTLDRATVMAPAIRAAERGFNVDAHYVGAVNNAIKRLTAEGTRGVEDFTLEERWLWRRLLMEGQPEVGTLIRQPELATTLQRLVDEGANIFYRGEIGWTIADHCPHISPRDLLQYQVEETRPLEGEYFGRRFLTMPPPSSGGVAMLQILGFLEYYENALNEMAWNEADMVHLLIEAMKHAFADRAEWLADSKFVSIPIERLTSAEYIADLASRFNAEHTFDPVYYGSRVAPPPEDHGTSHLSIVDQWGNAVACTETINLEFGSLHAVPEWGIVLNDEMDDFLTQPGKANAFGLMQSDRNLPAPGKRPLSSMSPTIVLNESGEVEIIAGASGGPRIITGTLQVILSLLFDSDDPRQAVAAPRFHHQWMPDAIYFEEAWPENGVRERLAERGHEIRAREAVGVVQVIARQPDGGYLGASDPRKGGEATGW